ncbi:MAG: class I SAM-dependent methyltransferase [Candidatus Electryoneaceae bacterium]|nr:class I SAM-dependent methyltransferase [Candidatus Electryoneaceae bacterium]
MDYLTSPRLLECACGTGMLAMLLALNGYRIDAFDRSPEMIEVARVKSAHLDNSPNFTVADFQTFDYRRTMGIQPLKTGIRNNPHDKYTAALCLYDSVNYLMETEHIVTFLTRVFNSLKNNGLFLFDICTVFNSQRFFSNQIENIRGLGYNCIRKMNFDSKRMIQENIFMIQYNNQTDDPTQDDTRQSNVYIEKHYQRIYSLPVIRRLIAESGFHILEETDGKSRRPPHNGSLRVHFLCRREPQ